METRSAMHFEFEPGERGANRVWHVSCYALLSELSALATERTREPAPAPSQLVQPQSDARLAPTTTGLNKDEE